MIACSRCGGENPEHAKFCLHRAASRTLTEQRREDPEAVRSVVGRTFESVLASIGAER